MKKKKTVISRNYLDRVPFRPLGIGYHTDSDGLTVLEVENRGIMNRIAQKLLGKPRISYIHLDRFGSFVWNTMDGQMSLTDIGKRVEEHFGEEAHPLYERLATYFKMLDSYKFVKWA